MEHGLLQSKHGLLQSKHGLLQVDHLILLLKAAETVEAVEANADSSIHQEIVSLATEYLTVGPNVGLYHQKVRDAGYPVYPGEVDRFGWLTAYFHTKHGIILFG